MMQSLEKAYHSLQRYKDSTDHSSDLSGEVWNWQQSLNAFAIHKEQILRSTPSNSNGRSHRCTSSFLNASQFHLCSHRKTQSLQPAIGTVNTVGFQKETKGKGLDNKWHPVEGHSWWALCILLDSYTPLLSSFKHQTRNPVDLLFIKDVVLSGPFS